MSEELNTVKEARNSEKIKRFKVKHTNVPILGYLDSRSERLGERILHTVVTSTWTIPLQLLRRGDTIEAVDTVWVKPTGELMGRFRTAQGVLVCIPYAKLDALLEEVPQ